MVVLCSLPSTAVRRERVCFSRPEIRELLSLYTSRVVTGEWRDYAIDVEPERAVFSVFRHSLARPLYTIEKFRRGDGYRLSSQGRQLKHAQTITEVIAAIARRPRLVADGSI